jgi:hypothetical protein
MVVGEKIVTVDGLKAVYDDLHSIPIVSTITPQQWSGGNSDWYISVSASNVKSNSILVPSYNKESAAYLKDSVWCVPSNGSVTIHTGALPSGNVTIMIQVLKND